MGYIKDYISLYPFKRTNFLKVCETIDFLGFSEAFINENNNI